MHTIRMRMRGAYRCFFYRKLCRRECELGVGVVARARLYRPAASLLTSLTQPIVGAASTYQAKACFNRTHSSHCDQGGDADESIFRIRRVKCDEAKPSCQRCTSTGRKCDGYNRVEAAQQANAVVLVSPQYPFTSSHGLDLASNEEAEAFHFFKCQTAYEVSSGPFLYHSPCKLTLAAIRLF